MENREKELELMIDRMIEMLKTVVKMDNNNLIDSAKTQIRETIEEAEDLIR